MKNLMWAFGLIGIHQGNLYLSDTHTLCSVERCLNHKKLHLEANLLSSFYSLSASHSSFLLFPPSSLSALPLPHPFFPIPFFLLFSYNSDFTLYTQLSKQTYLFFVAFFSRKMQQQQLQVKPKHNKLRRTKDVLLLPMGLPFT